MYVIWSGPYTEWMTSTLEEAHFSTYEKHQDKPIFKLTAISRSYPKREERPFYLKSFFFTTAQKPSTLPQRGIYLELLCMCHSLSFLLKTYLSSCVKNILEQWTAPFLASKSPFCVENRQLYLFCTLRIVLISSHCYSTCL